MRLRVKQDRGTGMIEKLRVIAMDRRKALTSAAKTLRNDPVVQDWWSVSYTHLTLPTIYSV